MAGGLADRWRARAIAEIDGDDIHALVEEVRVIGVPGLARRARAAMSCASACDVCDAIEDVWLAGRETQVES